MTFTLYHGILYPSSLQTPTGPKKEITFVLLLLLRRRLIAARETTGGKKFSNGSRLRSLQARTLLSVSVKRSAGPLSTFCPSSSLLLSRHSHCPLFLSQSFFHSNTHLFSLCLSPSLPRLEGYLAESRRISFSSFSCPSVFLSVWFQSRPVHVSKRSLLPFPLYIVLLLTSHHAECIFVSSRVSAFASSDS